MKNLLYILLAIGLAMLCWGLYGPLLRWGGDAMDQSHWLPFLFVGIAYFLFAVLATGAILAMRGEPGKWTVSGALWALAAGAAGAVGALGVVLAMTNGGSPIYVMPLVFGGAPVVNTLVSMWATKDRKEAGPLFYAGLILVIAGAAIVLIKNPAGSGAREISPGDLAIVLVFVAMTILSWGMYGPLLHQGQTRMEGSRLRPFFCVGMAYFLIAVILPLLLRATTHDRGDITLAGTLWSLAGGAAGAMGAMGIILAFTFGGKPVYVMPLVFGGAPVVSTLVSILNAKNLGEISPFFYAGLIVVIAGAVTVLIFAPRGQPHKPEEAAPAPASAEPAKT
jgi:drug/metabolite transporter (DMT)-like permease